MPNKHIDAEVTKKADKKYSIQFTGPEKLPGIYIPRDTLTGLNYKDGESKVTIRITVSND